MAMVMMMIMVMTHRVRIQFRESVRQTNDVDIINIVCCSTVPANGDEFAVKLLCQEARQAT